MPFYLTKISDVGTSNPIVARLTAGLPEIINIAKLSVENRQKVTDLLFDISQELIEAEKAAVEVMQEIEQIEAKISQLKEKTPNLQMPQVIDSVLSLNRARDFLKYSQGAFRRLGRIMSIIFDIGDKEHRFGYIITELEKKIPADAEILEVLKHYRTWSQKVSDLRDRDEHYRGSASFLLNYEIKQGDGFCYLERPRFYDDTPVYQFLGQSLKMLLPFSEELVVCALEEYLPEVVEVVEIPIDKRNAQCPKRFRLNVRGM